MEKIFAMKKWIIVAISLVASFEVQAAEGQYEFCGDQTSGYIINGLTVSYWWYDLSSKKSEKFEKVLPAARANIFKEIEIPAHGESCPKSSSYYGKDQDHVYYKGEAIEGADPITFSIFDTDYAKDKKHIYYGLRSISNRVDDFHRVEENRGSQYSTDGEKYYYEGIGIKGSEFEILQPGGYQYAKIDNKIFHQGKLVQKADAKTFDVYYPSFQIVKDGKHVFYNDIYIEGADPETFTFIDGTHGVFKDMSSVYFRGKRISSLNPSTVKASELGNYLLDDNFVYTTYSRDIKSEEIKILKNRDAVSFHELQPFWTVDKNGVYYEDKLFPEADQSTFISKNAGMAEDKNFRYIDGRISCRFSNETAGTFPICETSYRKM